MTHYTTGARFIQSIETLREGVRYYNEDTDVCIIFFGFGKKVEAMVQEYTSLKEIEWMKGTTSFKKINAFLEKYGLQFTDIDKM